VLKVAELVSIFNTDKSLLSMRGVNPKELNKKSVQELDRLQRKLKAYEFIDN
jgi:hypothetical protein